MARLLAADVEPMAAHMLHHIAITDLGALEGELLAGEEPFKPEIGHDRRNDPTASEPAVAMPRARDHRHQLVAIDDIAVLIRDDHPVGVSIEGNPDIGPDLAHLLAHRLWRG